jgi:hypothetical protein
MRTSLRRKGAIATVFAMVAATLAVLVPASPAGAVNQTNACLNSVTANATQLDVDTSATAPASVAPGESFQININQTLALPGTLFVAGYNLGLLQVGVNNIPGTIRTIIEGTNTTQGAQTTATVNVSVTTTITDPDGLPGTGDESATPATVTVNYPAQTWTAGASGTISFRQDTIPFGPGTGGSVLVTAVIGGFLNVQFRCNPGTVTPPDPGVITLTDPAATFATTTITTGPTTTAPTTTAPTTTAPTTTAPTTTAPTTTAPTTTAPTTTAPTTTAPTTTAPTTTAPTTTAPTPVAPPPPPPVMVQPSFTG